MPKFIVNQEYIPVSSYFVENFLKDASGVFVKVYLYSLSLAVKNAEVDTAFIASELDLLESDVIQAFSYWKNLGMIVEDSGIIEFCDKPITELTQAEDIHPSSAEAQQTVSRKHYDSMEIAKKITENQSLSDVALLAQELLSKPITSSEMETIYWFYDELRFSSESILLLLDYCISKNKRSFSYIEKVAISWHEQGITTPEAIVDFTAKEEEKSSYMFNLRKGMGIADRALSQKEEEYITKWFHKYSFPEDMILLAYEYCMINTSKLSFPYMDKIIEQWNKKGIKTRAAAEEDNKKFKSKPSSAAVYTDDFNHNALEQLTRK